MTNDQYIEAVLAQHALKPGLWSSYVPGIIIPDIQKWAGSNLLKIVYTGSVAKGTGISGTTDLDIFISLHPDTPHTLQDIYERLFKLSEAKSWIPRKQNVSIGISYCGVKIDLVPGKLQDGYKYFHSLWRNKAQTWTQAAPEIHIDKVVDSRRLREIRAIKVWRKNHGLAFPSFYVELAVMRALSGCGWSLENNVQRALRWIADNIETATFEDPANTANIISQDLTAAEKTTIAQRAQASYDEQYWRWTLW